MDFEEIVFSRRSIRSFTAQPVSDGLIERLIAYGHAAPSGGNLKEWRFIVVKSEQGKQRLTQATYRGNRENSEPQSWIMSAPVVIAVAADLGVAAKRYGRKGIAELTYLDCSAAVENMLLGAVHLGLGACYISGFREQEVSEALGLPETVQAVALIPVGYAAAEGSARHSASARSVTSYEVFGSQSTEGNGG